MVDGEHGQSPLRRADVGLRSLFATGREMTRRAA
jgi:hypothetical protein